MNASAGAAAVAAAAVAAALERYLAAIMTLIFYPRICAELSKLLINSKLSAANKLRNSPRYSKIPLPSPSTSDSNQECI